MKQLLFTILALFAALGCVTNPETGKKEPDWPKVAQGFDLAAGELSDIQAVTTDESLKEQIGDVITACQIAADAARSINPGNMGGVFDAVLAITGPLIESVQDENLKLALMTVRSAARLASFLAGEPPDAAPLEDPAPAEAGAR